PVQPEDKNGVGLRIHHVQPVVRDDQADRTPQRRADFKNDAAAVVERNHFRELGIGDVKNAVAPCDGHGAGEFGSTYAFVTPPRSVGKIGVANQIRLGVGDAEVGGFV